MQNTDSMYEIILLSKEIQNKDDSNVDVVLIFSSPSDFWLLCDFLYNSSCRLKSRVVRFCCCTQEGHGSCCGRTDGGIGCICLSYAWQLLFVKQTWDELQKSSKANMTQQIDKDCTHHPVPGYRDLVIPVYSFCHWSLFQCWMYHCVLSSVLTLLTCFSRISVCPRNFPPAAVTEQSCYTAKQRTYRESAH